jgi:hypothetical protein
MNKQLSLVSLAILTLGLSACAEMEAVDATALRSSGQLCAFVLGEVGGQSVATPAIPVYVPSSGLTVDPVKVHVDESEQVILGYSIPVPGVDYGTHAHDLYIPGVDTEIPTFAATLPELGIDLQTCLAAGVSTPAIPVHVPESVLTAPGSFVDVPAIGLNLLGHEITVPGRLLETDGRTIVLPGADAVVPGLEIQTPERTIAVEIDGTPKTIDFMDPAL